jgi:hypothetical protein
MQILLSFCAISTASQKPIYFLSQQKRKFRMDVSNLKSILSGKGTLESKHGEKISLLDTVCYKCLKCNKKHCPRLLFLDKETDYCLVKHSVTNAEHIIGGRILTICNEGGETLFDKTQDAIYTKNIKGKELVTYHCFICTQNHTLSWQRILQRCNRQSTLCEGKITKSAPKQVWTRETLNILFEKGHARLLTNVNDNINTKTSKIYWQCTQCDTKYQHVLDSVLAKQRNKNIYFCNGCERELQAKQGKLTKQKNVKKGHWHYCEIQKIIQSKDFILVTTKEEFQKEKTRLKGAVKANIKISCQTCKKEIQRSVGTVIEDSFRCANCEHNNKRAQYYKQLLEMFESAQWEMLSPLQEYMDDPIKESCHVHVWAIDSMGNKVQTTHNRFEQGHRSQFEADKAKRLDIEEVRERFIQKGFIPLFQIYETRNDYLEYICYCGNIRSMQLFNLKSNITGCISCSRDSRKIPNEIVAATFEKAGCVVDLSETPYVKNSSPIPFTCVCGRTGKTSFKSFRKGTRCPHCTEEKRQITNLRIYGVTNFLASEEGKKKIREHWMKIVPGAYHSSHIPNIIAAREKTHLKNRGVKCNLCLPEIKKLRDDAMLAKYDVVNFMQSPKFIEKMIELYGVEHSMQNAELFTKMMRSSFRRKIYIFPSGRIEKIQGYEPQCVDLLLAQGIPENDIVLDVKHIPIIKYTKTNTKTGYYYPDIFIPSKVLVIEVKSVWTFALDKKNNICKWKEASKTFTFKTYIFKRKGGPLTEKRIYKCGQIRKKIKYARSEAFEKYWYDENKICGFWSIQNESLPMYCRA